MRSYQRLLLAAASVSSAGAFSLPPAAATGLLARARATPRMAEPPEKPEIDLEVRKQQAKARRINSNFGTGGVRAGRVGQGKGKAKRTERKKEASGRGFGGGVESLNYNRKPGAWADCGCGSGKKYGDCCQPLHEGTAKAESASALVRARYTAYAYRVPEYLVSSTDPDGPEWETDRGRWTKSLLSFCDDFSFQKLVVHGEEETGEHEVTVEFVADFVQKGTLNLMALREHSVCRWRPLAERRADDTGGGEGEWLYVAGTDTYENASP